MDFFPQILADARASRTLALEQLELLNTGQLKIVNGMSENHARELLRPSIADYDAIISRLGR